MEPMELRSTWTDLRLDDLNGRVGELSHRMDEGFRQVDNKFDGVHREITELRAEISVRFDSLRQSMLRFGGALLVAVVGTMLAFVLGAH
jgi:hypothetical protein